MLALVIKKKGFRAPLTLVITGSRTDWIDFTPIVLGLRVNIRVPINL